MSTEGLLRSPHSVPAPVASVNAHRLRHLEGGYQRSAFSVAGWVGAACRTSGPRPSSVPRRSKIVADNRKQRTPEIRWLGGIRTVGRPKARLRDGS